MGAGHQVRHISAYIVVRDVLGGHLDQALFTQDKFDEVVVVFFHREAEVAGHRQAHIGA